MKILHYSLGFPPYRTGGLTKFCMDCMKEQQKQGHTVAMIWPGQIKIFDKKNYVLNRGQVNVNGDYFQSYEIINPLPVPYDEGIQNVNLFMASGDIEAYKSFFKKVRPDVIHVHTFMGLHKNLLNAAKQEGIRLVFSTHDFFPICPKVTMFKNGSICDTASNCTECSSCNQTALSEKKMVILQTALYRQLKESKIVKKLRKSHRDNYLSEQTLDIKKTLGNETDKYIALRRHYYEMLLLMDVIHFNSSVTKVVYDNYFKLDKAVIIPITHGDISDNRKIKVFDDKIRFTYLGAQSSAKGFYILKKALDALYKVKQNFKLNIYFEPSEKSPYMEVHNRYTYDELGKIMDDTDVLIVPSLWNETFGYTALEALSYGVPVVISDRVGAKDILNKNSGIVVNNINENKLLYVLKSINSEKLSYMNLEIVNNQNIITMEEMIKNIETYCYM